MPETQPLDVVTTSILSAKLEAAVRDMATTLATTAHSNQLSTSRSFGCAILDADGEVVAIDEPLQLPSVQETSGAVPRLLPIRSRRRRRDHQQRPVRRRELSPLLPPARSGGVRRRDRGVHRDARPHARHRRRGDGQLLSARLGAVAGGRSFHAPEDRGRRQAPPQRDRHAAAQRARPRTASAATWRRRWRL